MSVKTLTIEFVFEEELVDEDYVHLSLAGISLGDTNLTEEQREAVAEDWGQSDTYYIDNCNDILHVVASGEAVNY